MSDDLTPPQRERINVVKRRFGCENDYRIETSPFDLPEGWVLVTIGENKGRPFQFGVSPEGESHS